MSDVERLDEAQQDGGRGSLLTSVTNAMVALHKERLGRGPVRAHTTFTDDDTLLCTLLDSLLPAELALTEMGHQLRVQEARLFFWRDPRQVRRRRRGAHRPQGRGLRERHRPRCRDRVGDLPAAATGLVRGGAARGTRMSEAARPHRDRR